MNEVIMNWIDILNEDTIREKTVFQIPHQFSSVQSLSHVQLFVTP